MYFAPALEDLCIKWSVPKRTAAALFVALANGAPDLASTGYMFKRGQGDMAFGALLGASAYVCMNVIAMIIRLKPKGPVQATPALLRDIISYGAMLCLLFPIFLSGLTREWMLVLSGSYALLTGAASGCFWCSSSTREHNCQNNQILMLTGRLFQHCRVLTKHAAFVSVARQHPCGTAWQHPARRTVL
jgi:Ca2+/Na+ antiporter